MKKVNFFNFILSLEFELIDNDQIEISDAKKFLLENGKKKLLEKLNERKAEMLIESGKKFKSDFENINQNSNLTCNTSDNTNGFSVAARQLTGLSESDKETIKQSVSMLNNFIDNKDDTTKSE